MCAYVCVGVLMNIYISVYYINTCVFICYVCLYLIARSKVRDKRERQNPQRYHVKIKFISSEINAQGQLSN